MKETHAEKIKRLWKEGRYDKRNDEYRKSDDYKHKISETVKDHWKNGVYSKERNEKIAKKHTGKSKSWLKKKPYEKCCEFCNANFSTKIKRKRFCCRSCSCKFSAKNRNPMSSETKQKISKKLKGRMPKNMQYITTKNNSYRQLTMFNIIKEYFPEAKQNFYVKTKTKRWLDTALPEDKIDFEYDGMVHLRKNVIENDKIRTKELEELGWKIIRFNKDNFHTIRDVLSKMKIAENGDVEQR